MSKTLADQLWLADRDLTAECARHPFVTGLADGSLPAWRYRSFVAQDVFVLRALRTACELAASHGSDGAGRALYTELVEGVEATLDQQRVWALPLGIDLDVVVPDDTTLATTDFLRATAALRPEACALAALVPSFWVETWLAQRLLPGLVDESPGAEWVRARADPARARLGRRLAARLEPALLERDDVERAELARLHRRALHLRHRRFVSAWGGEAPGRPPVALSIAGSDPSGGAGIQADLKSFHRAGVYGQAVVTLLTAQNTRGVQGVFLQDVAVVRAQLRSVLGDLGAAAAKTGALGSAAIVDAVADELGERPVGALVIDPVLVSKHGHELADTTVVEALRSRLLPMATLITPNRFEATRLTGIDVDGRAAAERAAARLLADGARAVLVKDVPGQSGDLFVDAAGARMFTGPRIDTVHRHGSGCTFSAAIVAQLARGAALDIAIDSARDTIVRALASAPGLGHVGPVNHWA